MHPLILSTLLLTAGAAEEVNNFPEWVLNTPDGHSSYCIPITSEHASARKAAVLYAGITLGNGVERQEVGGFERSLASDHDGVSSSKYEQTIQAITMGDAPTVQVVEEQLVGQQLCVLVKAL